MTDINNTSSGADTAVMGFDRPSQTPPLLPGRMQDDIDTWSTLVDRVREAAQRRGWTKAEVARRAGMASGTFSQWYSGNYAGRLDRQNDIISRWLDALDDQAALAATIPTGPAFLRLKAADEIVQTLRWAQLCPDLVVITAGSGVGKTAACSHYLRTVPHSHMVTISPHTKTVHGLLCAIVETLGINQRNPARYVEAIGRRLETTGGGALLIVDEAQNLVDEAINQLRHFVDRHGCGIALVRQRRDLQPLHQAIRGAQLRAAQEPCGQTTEANQALPGGCRRLHRCLGRYRAGSHPVLDGHRHEGRASAPDRKNHEVGLNAGSRQR